MPKTILAIDDEPRVLKTVSEMLRVKGYEVKTAESAVDGLKLLVAGDIDLVIVDIKMPGMDGYETYEEIRHNPGMCSTPVLFLTAFTNAFSVDKEPAAKAWREHFGEGVNSSTGATPRARGH
ncbi:response regulator [Planctomycetota bacterium]